jgi:AbiU2
MLLAIHETAAKHTEVFDLLNTASLFWNTILGALQTSALVVLGRVFDLDKGSHSVNRLLDLAEGNPQIFTPDAFAARRQGSSPTRPEYLDDYLTSVYVPLPAEFQALRQRVDEQRTIYAAYKDIRNKIFAHKDIASTAKMHELLGKTNIREWQTLTLFLQSLYDALWQLQCNGIKPVLREYRCSVEAMLNEPIPAGRQTPPQEKIARQAAEFLTAAATRGRS